MSVRVSLDSPGFGTMNIDRPTMHMMIDGPTQDVTQFIEVLQQICVELRRMYPLPVEKSA